MQLTIENLTVHRGGRPVLEELSFSLESGEALLLTGPNGAGKTTLIRTIAGFLRPMEGAVTLGDGGENIEIAEQCHYVGHLNAVKASLSVAENLAFWACFLVTAGKNEPGNNDDGGSGVVEDALRRFNLASLRHIPAGYLSAGQKRRLGLARLSVASRPLWLLDEPTVSLDANSQAILAGAVNEHVSAGGMAIAATHLPLGLTSPKELRLGGGARVSGGADGNVGAGGRSVGAAQGE